MYEDILNSCWSYNSAKKRIPDLDKYTNQKDFKRWRFEQLARKVHGDKYDYSKVNPVNKTTKVTIFCPVHGEFEQAPRDHITRKHGCKKCAADTLRLTRDEFISRSKEKHGNTYNYSLVPETMPGINNKVTIVCSEHGPFSQEVSSHLRGFGCSVCSNRKLSTLEEFIRKAKDVHGDSFDYSQIEKYSGNKSLVPIKCNSCNNISMVIPNNHLRGHKCKYCLPPTSKAELELKEYIESLGFSTTKYVMKDGKHIDIFVPELNIGFEYNGIYWHSSVHKPKTYHLNKTIRAEKEGVSLIHIWEDDWINKQEILKDIILSKLGKSKRIYARNTEVTQVDSHTARRFLNDNHIQGYSVSSINLGLVHKNELVMLLTLGKPRFDNKYDLEIVRIASKRGLTVVGGASKLLARVPKGTNVLSYARRDYSEGNLYKTLGFHLEKTTDVDYWYSNKTGNKVSRYKAMKKNLESLLPKFNPDLTEEENMVKHGFHKIYGCGNLVFSKEL